MKNTAKNYHSELDEPALNDELDEASVLYKVGFRCVWDLPMMMVKFPP